ncbi:MAG: Hpt domain-containing protein [Methylococcales bacterium]|nr:Hpt domain-containing protein [Methylococcales bacterium]
MTTQNNIINKTEVETKINPYISMMLGKTSGNYELATTIFNKLFLELKEQSQLIEEALTNKNLALAEQITHKLHGSVSFCGFTDIQEIAKAMEISLAEKNHQLIPSNFQQLKNKIFDFISLKEDILNQL